MTKPLIALPTRREFLQYSTAGLSLAAGLGSAGRALARAKTYTNPVYSGSMPDPGVIRHDGVYYAFGTTGPDRKADGRIFTVLRSTDLVTWIETGGALTPPSDDPAFQYWAPEVALEGGTFYLYYAMGGKEPEKFTIRVATSSKPEGPYTDNGTPLVDCEPNRFTIDAHPFRDDDGTWYLFYAKNFPNEDGGAHPGTAVVVDRLVGMTKLAGECKTVVRARFAWTLYEAHRRMDVYDKTFDWHTIEGPWVRKHAGKYYCFYSGSNYQTDRYGVDYVVADRVTGPYSGAGESARFLHGISGKVRGPGHHSIVLGPDGKTEYAVYHAWDRDMKTRQLCVDRVEWTKAGPRCTPTVTPQPAPKA